MKILFFFLLIIIGIISCKPEPNDLIEEYLIKNSSNHNVELLFFNVYINDNITKDTVFSILSNSYIEYHPPFGGTNDSVYVIFDNIRQTIYNRNDGQVRNILDVNNFTGSKVDVYLYQYVYEITKEDYENAIELK